MGTDKPHCFHGKLLNHEIFSYLQFLDIMHKDLKMKNMCIHLKVYYRHLSRCGITTPLKNGSVKPSGSSQDDGSAV
jgi:hypothetical protein